MTANAPDDSWAAGDAYETYMGRWSRPIARRFVEWLRPNPSSHWLDFGCGTGALSSTILEVCAPASVVACDPSQPFIDYARTVLADTRASLTVAAADSLPRRSGGFDVVVSGLVLNFLPNPESVMMQVSDRLRKGGIVAAYVWDYAEGMELLSSFWAEAVAEDSRAAAVDERRRFPLCREPSLRSLFQGAGLSEVQIQTLGVPIEFATFDDYWAPFLRGTGPAPSYVASLDSRGRDALRERLRRRLVGQDKGIRLHARAMAVRGVAP